MIFRVNGAEEEFEYRLDVWFVYRYLWRNPCAFDNAKIQEFFKVLDNYFVTKYTKIMGTEKDARREINNLFAYESERPRYVDEQSILKLIEKYETNKNLLTEEDPISYKLSANEDKLLKK